MARLLAVLLALVCAVHAVQGALPVPPLPQQCTGPAQGAVPRSDLNWPTNQTKLAQELSNADKEKGVDVIFYGDSITWLFRGENLMGASDADDQARRDVFQRHFGQYKSAIQAIPGDQSGNLLWRITMGGEWPTVHMPKTVYILIGTNDLTFADCNNDVQEIEDAATGIIDRVTQIITFIHTASPSTKIVLLGIMPRGAQYWEWDQAWLWPNRYQPAIAAVNAGYYALALLHPDYIKYIYCGAPYSWAYGINWDLLEDGIHPNPKGLDMLAACVQPDIDADMQVSAS